MATVPEFVDSNFNGLSINDFIVKLAFIAEKQQHHAAFQGELPEYVTRWEKLLEQSELLAKARAAAAGNDKFRVAELNALWEGAKKSLALNAIHLNLLAHYRNDPALPEGAGYDAKQKSSKLPPVSVLDLVPEVYVKHQVPPHGSVSILVKRARQTAIIELQMSYGDPADESSWIDLGMHLKSRIEQRGLKVASVVHLRARYHHAGRNGDWSSATSIVVI